ncbi:hypothetical protein [Flavobacterium rivuli]|uniref:hypothetical protein n=1 Tax=Flavobacterium rivuli TaxID=498301 RepID=UPI000379901E|nr:hypothetical protein [Flavobacterium rivuli]
MKKIIINPFEKFTEIQLFILGVALTVGGSLLSYLLKCRVDGVLHIGAGINVTIAQSFIDSGIATFSLFIVFYVLGLVINKKTRLIDILNTVLIGRSPMYLLTLGNVNGLINTMDKGAASANTVATNFSPVEYAGLLFFSLFAICFLVWIVALLYNGFKTATNLKSTTHKIAFGVSIFFAGIVAEIIVYSINY